MSETRKLAAIPVADVVGYSLLADAGGDRTLARLRDKLAEIGKMLHIAARPLRLMCRTLVLVNLAIWAFCGAAAANDTCTKQPNSFIYTCSGNQSAGVAFNNPSPPSGATIVPSTATGINITNLTSNVTGPVSINVQPDYTLSFPVTFSDPNYSIVLPQPSTSGILETVLDQRFNWYTSRPNPLPSLSLIVNGSVTAGGTNAPAISLRSQAAGGAGGSSKVGNGNSGEPGFFPRPVSFALGGAVGGQPPTNGVVTRLGGSASPATPTIFATSVGGKGGSGGAGGSSGGNGGQGGPGETVTGTTSGTWSVSGVQTGLLLVSQGGQGGSGGQGDTQSGGNGGRGGNGGQVSFDETNYSPFTVTTTGDTAPGIQLISQGGNGGGGGRGVTFGRGGTGGAGGLGGSVTAAGHGSSPGGLWNITTAGSNSAGLGAYSLGGIGGDGGDGGFFSGGGGGGGSGTAGPVVVNSPPARRSRPGAPTPLASSRKALPAMAAKQAINTRSSALAPQAAAPAPAAASRLRRRARS